VFIQAKQGFMLKFILELICAFIGYGGLLYLLAWQIRCIDQKGKRRLSTLLIPLLLSDFANGQDLQKLQVARIPSHRPDFHFSSFLLGIFVCFIMMYLTDITYWNMIGRDIYNSARKKKVLVLLPFFLSGMMLGQATPANAQGIPIVGAICKQTISL
jgi:hypothetical protein